VAPPFTRTSFLQRELKSLFTRAWKVFILVRIPLFVFVSSGIERVLNNGGAGDVLPPPSTTQQIKGDWVLFHPVYSREELKAVEVSHSNGDPITERFG
jgi:hypothetical protein